MLTNTSGSQIKEITNLFKIRKIKSTTLKMALSQEVYKPLNKYFCVLLCTQLCKDSKS